MKRSAPFSRGREKCGTPSNSWPKTQKWGHPAHLSFVQPSQARPQQIKPALSFLVMLSMLRGFVQRS
jgi:hypothetical protein